MDALRKLMAARLEEVTARILAAGDDPDEDDILEAALLGTFTYLGELVTAIAVGLEQIAATFAPSSGERIDVG